eukprot:232039-Pleurochrysis_carterae.AAC.1
MNVPLNRRESRRIAWREVLRRYRSGACLRAVWVRSGPCSARPQRMQGTSARTRALPTWSAWRRRP